MRSPGLRIQRRPRRPRLVWRGTRTVRLIDSREVDADGPQTAAGLPRWRRGRNAMRVYRYAWLIVTATLVMSGDTGVLLVSPALLGVLFLVFAIVGAVLMLLGAGGHGKQTARSRTRRVVTGAFVLGTTAPACVGFAIVLGSGAPLLLLVVVASSPHAVGAFGRWIRSDPPSTTTLAAWAPRLVWPIPGWAPPLLGPELDRLSTAELCQAWCVSYLLLMDRSAEPGIKALLAIVEERQRYLDEFERRNPTASLPGSPRAPGSPATPWPTSSSNRPLNLALTGRS